MTTLDLIFDSLIVLINVGGFVLVYLNINKRLNILEDSHDTSLDTITGLNKEVARLTKNRR